jgi:peptidyl-prolyl cis-trans isomerase D
MLTSIRTTFAKGFARWILIGLMALLILSFGIWGIQDVFTGFRSNEVVSVGKTVVSTEQFQRIYNREVQQLSRRIGKPISPAEARLLGLDRQVLERLTASALLDEQASAYRLGLSSERIAAAVMEDPNFRSPSGQFDRNYFAAILRENGMSEPAFFAEQQRVYLRGQLGESVAGKSAVPDTMLAAFARFRDETRSISYVTLTDALVGDVGQPEPAALQAFYEERKGEFRSPEFRKFTYIAITPEDLAAKVTVTDDDAKAEYEAHKDRYTTAEKRTVQQIAFQSAVEAQAAAGRISGGQATFDQIATERNLKPADLDLGTVTKAELLDPVVAEEAFKLPEGGVSGAVQGKLSTSILRVTKVEPAVVTPFETARDQIEKSLAVERARRDLGDLQDKVEDERAGGASLKEIADKFKLEAREILAMDAQGRDAAGQPYNLPLQADLVKAIFANEPGADTEVVDGRDQGLVWYHVDAIEGARERTLDEAKGDVLALWTKEEKGKRLQARAEDLLKELESGKPLDEVAKASNLEVKQAWGLKRNGEGQGLSAAAVNLVFATPVKGRATALSGNGSDRVVFEVTESIVPPFDAKGQQNVALSDQLSGLIGQDLLTDYVRQLEDQLGLEVNNANLSRAVGAGES